MLDDHDGENPPEDFRGKKKFWTQNIWEHRETVIWERKRIYGILIVLLWNLLFVD